jgi:hypothetical protein
LTDEGFSFISSLTNLTDLNMNICEKIIDNGISYLSSLEKIEILDIINCKITNVGLYHISCLINIKILKMSLQTQITNEGFVHLCKLKEIKNIYMDTLDDRYVLDINLSPDVINKFVNINEFSCRYGEIKPVDGVKGFLHIRELRKQRDENGEI